MTTIDEVLGKCERVVEFEKYTVIKLMGPCKDCTGYPSEALKRNCTMYHPYLKREYGLKPRGVRSET